jgi:ABC-2 type transport system ATP-binding protein
LSALPEAAAGAIEATGLTKRFGEVTAVDGVELSVPRGSIFGFLGPNGAGKSTTVRMLVGLLRPDAGRIRILGIDPEDDPLAVKRSIGVVPDGAPLFERLTGAEYLAFVGRMHRLPGREAARRAEELLVAFELAEEQGKLIADYSHGMRKKIALAGAILHGPRVLFLDEPFEGVDPVAARTIRDLLTDLARREITVFLTSHVLEIVDRLCTDVAILAKGRIAATAHLDDLRKTTTLEDLFLRTVGASAPAKLSWVE